MKVRKKTTAPPPAFYDVRRDGITFSVLDTWRECRERSRLGLAGWTERETTFPLIFGTVIHEVLARIYGEVQAGTRSHPPGPEEVRVLLAQVEAAWEDENPMVTADAIQHLQLTLAIAEALLPQYFAYWAADFSLAWHRLEREFKLPMSVSGVDTFLRGKIDGIFSDRPKDPPRLFETKTKSRFDPDIIGGILPFELQVNIYLLALQRLYGVAPTGVRYNIIRRPQLRQKVTEPVEAFVHRIAMDIADRPDWYFCRLDMDVSPQDLSLAQSEITGLIEDFVKWTAGTVPNYKNSRACENKYGTCPMLAICGRGDTSGFYKRETVFRELGEV